MIDTISVKEMGKIKRWMIDKKRSKRKNNIVIKGIKLKGDERVMGVDGLKE